MARLALLSAYYLLKRHKWCLDSLAEVSAANIELARKITLKLPVGFDPYELLRVAAAAHPSLALLAKEIGGDALVKAVEECLFEGDGGTTEPGALAPTRTLFVYLKEAQELFARHGWIMECESPLELRNEDSQAFIRGNEPAEALLRSLLEGEACGD